MIQSLVTENDDAQNLNYNEDEHDIGPVFPSPGAGRHAALRVASQVLDSDVQIDACITQLLQSPSQRDSLREQGVELPLHLPQHGQPQEDLGELDSSILRSPERVVIRDGGVLLPFNEAASEAADGASTAAAENEESQALAKQLGALAGTDSDSGAQDSASEELALSS